MATLTDKITAALASKLTLPLSSDGGAPIVQNGFFGTKLTNGGGNWGAATDRAMGNTYTLADNATLKKGFLWIIPASGSGSFPAKMALYTNNAGAAGTRIAVSSSVVISGSGWIEFAFNNEIVPAGQYHILAIGGAPTGVGWDMGSADSGGLPAARIYNGSFSYTSPPATAPAPDTFYNNGLAVYVEYTF